jgi:hypothetical protein
MLFERFQEIVGIAPVGFEWLPYVICSMILFMISKFMIQTMINIFYNIGKGD